VLPSSTWIVTDFPSRSWTKTFRTFFCMVEGGRRMGSGRKEWGMSERTTSVRFHWSKEKGWTFSKGSGDDSQSNMTSFRVGGCLQSDAHSRNHT
jgi:hypothetical protein